MKYKKNSEEFVRIVGANNKGLPEISEKSRFTKFLLQPISTSEANVPGDIPVRSIIMFSKKFYFCSKCRKIVS